MISGQLRRPLLATLKLGSPKSFASRPTYVHPLTDAALSELTKLAPPWFSAEHVVMHPKEGTMFVSFHFKGTDGTVSTYYDREARHHFLSVRYGDLAGRVSLTDSSKSAWQSNIGDDLARVPLTVRELSQRIQDAAAGILPGDDRAAPPAPRPEPAAVFPFPDNVRPPEG